MDSKTSTSEIFQKIWKEYGRQIARAFLLPPDMLKQEIVFGFDPARPGGDKSACVAAVRGHKHDFVILDDLQQGGSMSGVTVTGTDLMDARAKLGLGRNPDRCPMIEVDFYRDYNDMGGRKPPTKFTFRSSDRGDYLRKEGLTRQELEKQIKKVLDAHFARVAAFEREEANNERRRIKEQLKAAEKSVAAAKTIVKETKKKLEGR